MGLLDEIVLWFAGLPTSFAFLVALPFVIAFVTLLKDAAERRSRRHRQRKGRRGES